MLFISISLCVLAILLDVINLLLGLRRLRGEGPSGVPVIGVVFFAAGIVMYASTDAISQATMWTFLQWYCLFHIAANFVVCLLIHFLLKTLGK